jgi:hypothetical protein
MREPLLPGEVESTEADESDHHEEQGCRERSSWGSDGLRQNELSGVVSVPSVRDEEGDGGIADGKGSVS